MIRPLLLTAALLALSSAASAQDLPPASNAPQASTPPSVAGGSAGAGRYGRGNATPEMRQARQAMMQACSADLTKFCADSEGSTDQDGGRGARMQCLRAHAADVSPGCTQAMASMRAARQAASAAAPVPPGV